MTKDDLPRLILPRKPCPESASQFREKKRIVVLERVFEAIRFRMSRFARWCLLPPLQLRRIV